MDARYGTVLGILVAAAVLIGVLAAHAQSRTIAAPVPATTPTPLPVAPPGHVGIFPTSGQTEAVYDPELVTIKAGQKLTWTNDTPEAHTVTADNGAFDSGVLQPGKSFSWTPAKAGTYGYGDYLLGARGTVVVKP